MINQSETFVKKIILNYHGLNINLGNCNTPQKRISETYPKLKK